MAKGCTVYVGNIDFEIPEQKIIEELSAVGRVVNFKMVIDRITGKPKGFGFCEYESPLIAETAVQKLKIILKNRQLRINYAEVDMASEKKEEGTIPVEGLASVLNQMDKNNLKDVILYLKKMALEQPKNFRQLLMENKSLGVSIFHCLVELNLIDQDTVYTMFKENFKLEENKINVIERILKMDEDDIEGYPEDVQEKIRSLKNSILKDGPSNTDSS